MLTGRFTELPTPPLPTSTTTMMTIDDDGYVRSPTTQLLPVPMRI
jgi:hypothetical protein